MKNRDKFNHLFQRWLLIRIKLKEMGMKLNYNTSSGMSQSLYFIFKRKIVTKKERKKRKIR